MGSYWTSIMTWSEGYPRGIDKTPPKIVKWGAPVLIPVLTKLFNKCILGGIYPDSLKIARVKPIFKGGIKNEITSYIDPSPF